MRKSLKYVIVSFFYLIIFSSELLAETSPSFDCAKATTEVEKLICSDDELIKKIEKCKIYIPLNCRQISNQVEELTCSEAELLKFYEKMQKKYFELCKSLSSRDERIKLYKDRLEWINIQNSSDYMEFVAYNRRIFYLKESYQEKIDNLDKLLKKSVIK